MGLGILFALAAGLMWGLVFVVPLWLGDYPGSLQSVGRYLAFGLISLPLAWLDRRELRRLSRADWRVAFELAAIGNLLYYLCLASAIQRVGAPLPTLIIGTLPVVIALAASAREGGLRSLLSGWGRLPPLILIGIGLLLVHRVEEGAGASPVASEAARFAGIALAVVALGCWTWYPLRNAEWLRAHPERLPRAWATAQGVATLPLALLGYGLVWLVLQAGGSDYPMPLGPRPWHFVLLMLATGLLASWLGTLCWNEASQRLPPALAGQLIVFETLAALLYAFIDRGQWPSLVTLVGIASLLAGVVMAVRAQASLRASTSARAVRSDIRPRCRDRGSRS